MTQSLRSSDRKWFRTYHTSTQNLREWLEYANLAFIRLADPI